MYTLLHILGVFRDDMCLERCTNAVASPFGVTGLFELKQCQGHTGLNNNF